MVRLLSPIQQLGGVRWNLMELHFQNYGLVQRCNLRPIIDLRPDFHLDNRRDY